MPATANLTAYDAVLKQLYRGKNYSEATYKYAPFVALLPKDTSFVGKNMPIPIKYANPGGISNTFSNAQSDSESSRFRDFLLTRAKVYGTAKIDGENADATDSEAGSFVKAIVNEIDGTMEGVVQKLESDLFRNGSGILGVIKTVVGNTITLLQPDDIVNFEAGMTLKVSPNGYKFPADPNRAGQELVFGVNRTVGTLTSESLTWNTSIPDIAIGDAIMRAGDLNAAFVGLERWIPAQDVLTAPVLFGVDRSVDKVRFAGTFYDASTTGDTTEEALIEGQGMASREGAKIDTIFVNNKQFRKLIKSAGSKVTYPREPVMRQAMGSDGPIANISFAGLRIFGDYGPMDVIVSPKCPVEYAYLLQMDTWALNSVGAVPKILMRDGLRIQRIYNEDGYEVRIGGYGNLSCNKPGANAVVKLAV